MTGGSLKFTFDIAGERQLSRKLHGFLGQVTDWTPVFERIAADWSETQEQVFDTEGKFERSAQWEPLTARYAKWKAKHFPGMKILQRTGAMKAASVKPETEITPTRLVITIASPYAIYHQSHEPRTSNLPRRPFASLTGKQKSRWVGFLRSHLWAEP